MDPGALSPENTGPCDPIPTTAFPFQELESSAATFGRISMERTLAIVKPDGVARGLIGEVLCRMEASGLKIVAMKMIHMNKREAEGFYAVHRERPFFDSLTNFMSSGPAVVAILEGQQAIGRYRTLMGATDFQQAEEGTIRREFATDIEKNVVHGSDSRASADFEIGYFFSGLELAGG
jgi:nucleoside-diphosphate kinase